MVIDRTPALVLYSYWRSSAAYRVRIALNLKGLAFETVPVNLVRDGGEHHGEEFRSLNPQGLVPVLVHGDKVLTQSMAICEYLDECFKRYPLLPDGKTERARVRSLALQIACEIHPICNLRVQNHLKRLYGKDADTIAWMMHWMGEGFDAIERQLDGGTTAANPDHPGLFECFLVPQVYNAERFGLDLTRFPAISRVAARCRALPAFQNAAPDNQPDAVAV